MCAVCRGRGEVAAGITDMVVEYGPQYEAVDLKGRRFITRACYPIRVRVNPAAWDRRAKTIWMLEGNLFGSLWGLAICVRCHGTGMSDCGATKS